MKKILMIEDDKYKSDSVKDVINESNDMHETFHVKYLNPGLRELITKEYDLLILDMNMPQYEGGRIKDKLGLEALRQLKVMKKRYKHIPKIIVLSQTEDIEGLKEIVNDIVKGSRVESQLIDVMRFNPMSVEWSQNLDKHLRELC
ncbi:MAG: response regulator [Vallitaleaceae bacterium]|nr:response regulator [Vallitaleaceae bacterium]